MTGQLATGWRQVDGKWFYFNEVSAEPTWIFDQNAGTWVYNAGNKNRPLGAMYHNERTPEGYYVGPDGVWDGKEK